MGARHHFLISHAGTDHREYAGIGIDHYFQERRAVKVYELLQYGLDMIPFTDARGKLIAVGSSSIDEVLPMKKLFGAAKPLGEKHLLPLPDHTVALIVEENRLHRQVVVRDGLHLADVHPQTAVTIDVDDETIGAGELRADGSGQSESHGPHRTRGQERLRMLVIEILSGPHLMLADAGADDGVALSNLVQTLQNVV